MKNKVTVLLHLSEKDRQELNYDVPDIEYEKLMKQDFVLPISDAFRLELIEAIRNHLNLPDGYLKDYKATYKEGKIVVML